MVRNSVLVVAAHPDDEVLGCGGTIRKHVNKGDSVYVVVLGEGITSRAAQLSVNQEEKEQLKALRKCAEEANEILGTLSITCHDLPDNRMDECLRLSITRIIEQHLYEIKPNIVYTHHWGDLNFDHYLTHKAVITACRPKPNNGVQNILFFEIPSSTEWQIGPTSECFAPNWFVDISDVVEVKMAALQAYSPEIPDWPHARSLRAVENLASWRGASVGLEAAEGFVLGRHFEDMRDKT